MPQEFKDYMESDHTPKCLQWWDGVKFHKYYNVSFVDWRQLDYKHKGNQELMIVDTLTSLTNFAILGTRKEKHIPPPDEHYRTHAEMIAEKRRLELEESRSK
eukprot:TRINITY_DN820_c0_g1_i11.p1 TRINITY_DN820_c0_g1~~TRINITY_DN820_c0_g1_i11.p1  ORF type:complete len:102 (-),score=12.33 TRINITY_DN820_c0_g1_i11:102-407(-)